MHELRQQASGVNGLFLSNLQITDDFAERLGEGHPIREPALSMQAAILVDCILPSNGNDETYAHMRERATILRDQPFRHPLSYLRSCIIYKILHNESRSLNPENIWDSRFDRATADLALISMKTIAEQARKGYDLDEIQSDILKNLKQSEPEFLPQAFLGDVQYRTMGTGLLKLAAATVEYENR